MAETDVREALTDAVERLVVVGARELAERIVGDVLNEAALDAAGMVVLDRRDVREVRLLVESYRRAYDMRDEALWAKLEGTPSGE